MPRPLAFLAVLVTAAVVPPAAAQVRLDARVGVVASTNLVTDFVGQDAVTLRANLAPAVGVALDTRIDPKNRFGVTASVARSNLMVLVPGGSSPLLVLTTWTPTAVLTHELTPTLAVSAAAGAIVYDPDVQVGTPFADGTSVRALVGVGLHLRRPIGPHTAVGLDLAYDVHGFMTRALSNQGFVGQWVVHRVTLGVTFGHRDDAPQP